MAGECCDLNTCSIRKEGFRCRPASNDACDLDEYCDGIEEWCPLDVYILDGTPCCNRGDGHCLRGECHSHGSQCYLIWGRQSTQMADDVCYEKLNSFGKSS